MNYRKPSTKLSAQHFCSLVPQNVQRMLCWMGIAASEVDRIVDEGLLVESVKSAIQRRADDPAQPEQAGLYLPLELRRLFLLAPISHDCFMLRVLLGINVGTCSRIMRLGIDEFGEVLCAVLQELPRLEAHSATRCEITQM